MTENKDTETQFYESPWFIAPAIFVIALIATFAYIVYFQATTGQCVFSIMDITTLSNIHRNIGIVFFSFFGGGLAIWARFAHQKQLKQTDQQIENTNQQLQYTYEQIKNSVTANRNDRFAKVADMLGKDKSETSHGSGLHILYDLIIEEEEDIDEVRYMRCYGMIADWLRQNQGSPELRMNAMRMLGTTIGNYHNEIVEDYKTGHGLSLWPNLRGIDLQGLDLQAITLVGADLQGANLQDAKLQNADLQGANLRDAKLQNANLQEANIQGANLNKAILEKTNLHGIKFEWGTLKKANLRGAILKGIDLAGKNLETMRLGLVNLGGANLQDANLQKAHMGRVNFKDANIQNANFKDSYIGDAEMKEARGLTKEQILQATWGAWFTSKDEKGVVDFVGEVPGDRPILPDNLMQDPDVQGWLKNPPFTYDIFGQINPKPRPPA